MPETSFQVAIADSIVDQIQDCFNVIVKIFFEKDAEKKVLVNFYMMIGVT